MFTTLIVWMDYRFGGTKHTSEQVQAGLLLQLSRPCSPHVVS